ncbi:protein of unknown function [Pseudomonas sp. JV241A]|nr:protein of unknown function [Pseudomonas sp. JV241A]
MSFGTNFHPSFGVLPTEHNPFLLQLVSFLTCLLHIPEMSTTVYSLHRSKRTGNSHDREANCHLVSGGVKPVGTCCPHYSPVRS